MRTALIWTVHVKRTWNQEEDISPLGSSPLPDPQPQHSLRGEKEKERKNHESTDSAKTDNSTTSLSTAAGLLRFFAANASSQSSTRWRLSWRQYGREGQNALFSLTTGGFNTAIGFDSLRTDTTGQLNTAIGAGTLLANTGDQNTATGAGALLSNTTGGQNTANGAFALVSDTSGVANCAFGAGALAKDTTGSNNVAIGFDALFNQTNNNNVAIGSSALFSSTTGGGNIAIGNEAGLLVQAAEDTICIGAAGADVSGTCFIGSVRGVTTIHNNAMPVLIDSAGQLGTVNSSRRYKTDIKPIDKASESILALKPVSFRYKVHQDKTPQFGLIAEDVAEVNPNLVIYDADGKPFTVRYDAVNAMLLNEFLKAHRRMQEQDKRIEELTAQLKQQASQIQKVSAQLEASKPASRVVNNP